VAAPPRVTFRSSRGVISDHHPAADKPGIDVLAYSTDGTRTPPWWPPPDSEFTLVPEASGSWCYYNSASGVSQWDPPEGSTPLPQLTHPFDANVLFTDSPPRCSASFKSIGRCSNWLPLYEDAHDCILFFHRKTGAVRNGPWLSLRDDFGRIYFINLKTGQSRWFPPHRWMQGWVTRGTSHDRSGRLVHDYVTLTPALLRQLMPPELARLRVDGGAPYMDALDSPPYEPDEIDVRLCKTGKLSHPLLASRLA